MKNEFVLCIHFYRKMADFSHTNLPWAAAEITWLWEQYSNGATLTELCEGLDRYPDDVLLELAVNGPVVFEDVRGFGSTSHLELWHQQQLAFQTNPLFSLRERKRQREEEDRVYKLLRDLYTRK